MSQAVVTNLEAHQGVLRTEVEQIDRDIAQVIALMGRYTEAAFQACPKASAAARGLTPAPADPSIATNRFLQPTLANLHAIRDQKTDVLRQVNEQIAVVRHAVQQSQQLADDVRARELGVANASGAGGYGGYGGGFSLAGASQFHLGLGHARAPVHRPNSPPRIGFDPPLAALQGPEAAAGVGQHAWQSYLKSPLPGGSYSFHGNGAPSSAASPAGGRTARWANASGATGGGAHEPGLGRNVVLGSDSSVLVVLPHHRAGTPNVTGKSVLPVDVSPRR